MTEKLRPVVALAALLIAGMLWLSWIHDPSVRAGQRLRDSTVTVDAHRDSTDRRVSALAAESLELGGKLRRLARNDSVARGEIARLTGYIQKVSIMDTSAVASQFAARDSLIDVQAVALAAADTQLTIWRALAVERGELLTQALGERDSYRRIAIAWSQKAGKHFGCAGGPGVVVSVDGHVSAGVGFVCGIRP